MVLHRSSMLASWVFAAAILAVRCRRIARQRENRKPHIVFVLVDDLGWTGAGFNAKLSVQETDPSLRVFEADANFTPHLDRLAEEGVVLRRHYSYTSCTPTRMAVMTGRLPVRTGVLLSKIFKWDGGVNKTWGYEGLPVPPNGSSLAWKFKDAGYYTAAVGKMDGFGNDTPEHLPPARGFDESLVMIHHGSDNYNYRASFGGAGNFPPCDNGLSYYVKDFWDGDGPWKEADDFAEQPNPQSPYEKGVHKEDLYLARAVKVIQEHSAQRPQQRLFLYFATGAVHTPLQVPSELQEATALMMCEWNPDCLDEDGQCSLDTGSPQKPKPKGPAVGTCAIAERAKYIAFVRMLDANVGALRAALEEANMWKDTVLVFTSDNGGPIGLGAGSNNWPLVGGKGADWEGGARTLAFVSGGYLPEQARGTQMNQVMHATDWYATFLSLAGADWQSDNLDAVIGPVDSKDYWQNIVGRNDAEVRSELHLSPWSLMSLNEDGHWLKLMTGVQGFTMWTGPEYPNNTDAERPASPMPIGPQPLTYDCKEGCLFDLNDDPTEHVDLTDAVRYSRQWHDMGARLSQLNDEQYTEPWRGCKPITTLSCDTARTRYGSFYGPWIGDCPTCVNESYWKRCGSELPGASKEDCVPQTTNPCDCEKSRFDCLKMGDLCSWSLGKCALAEAYKGYSYSQIVLKTVRTTSSQQDATNDNFATGALD